MSSVTEPDRGATEGLWNRALRRVRRAWPLGSPTALKDAVSRDLSDDDAARVRRQIDACLEGRGGEVSARARAAELGETYLVLSPDGRRRFLRMLASDYDVDVAAIDDAVQARREAPDTEARRRAEDRLRRLLEAPRVRLLSQFNGLEEGVKFLVDLRAELIPAARTDPELKALDRDVFRLLAYWFDIGFLELRRITWDTSASLLEKLTEYEAVHAIRSWQDLKNRLGDDRRCYAYFHPSMPDEPLIFVEVALVNGIADNVHELLDEDAPVEDPERVDTAIFYSISNCQRGLAGVSFGNFLIKRVVNDLARELPNLKHYSTLSPIPGLRSWLDEVLARDGQDLEPAELESLRALAGTTNMPDAFAQVLNRRGLSEDDALGKELQPLLMRMAARYLIEARRGEHAHDRVAHFHLSNGARVERLNWAADLSRKGIEQSAGIMVNYLYKLSDIERNHEAYSAEGRIACSAAVRKLARG
jgi:malonyl-CoA decarboxylase